MLEEFDLGGSFFSVFEGGESDLESPLSKLDDGLPLVSEFDLDDKSFFLSVLEGGFGLDGRSLLLSVFVEDLDEASLLFSVFEEGGFGRDGVSLLLSAFAGELCLDEASLFFSAFEEGGISLDGVSVLFSVLEGGVDLEGGLGLDGGSLLLSVFEGGGWRGGRSPLLSVFEGGSLFGGVGVGKSLPSVSEGRGGFDLAGVTDPFCISLFRGNFDTERGISCLLTLCLGCLYKVKNQLSHQCTICGSPTLWAKSHTLRRQRP